MSYINPSKRMKNHTAEFVIHIGNGFICNSVRIDKMACPYDFIGENDIREWIIDQCQKHLPKNTSPCYKSFKIKILLDIEPYSERIENLKKAQKELWDKCVKKKIKMKTPTYGYMEDGKYIEK